MNGNLIKIRFYANKTKMIEEIYVSTGVKLWRYYFLIRSSMRKKLEPNIAENISPEYNISSERSFLPLAMSRTLGSWETVMVQFYSFS